ncbi:MAG: DUF4469 domain-containing protein [Tannerella sp.]|jgi:hypothetical protein|nr:DUF4469 domain-containing protein [Tannerella sp.]
MANLSTTDAVIVELYDNPLTERKDDRYGRVVNIASINEETLIERAIANGFNGNAASMKACCEAIKNEALKGIVRGEIVTCGMAHFAVNVDGVFTGDAPQWNRDINRLVVRVTPVKELRETLKSAPVKVLGMAPDGGVIASVTDVASGKVNEKLTPGGMANIRGTHIKIAGDQPGIGLRITDHDTQKLFTVPSTSIGTNDPSKISFVIPAGLPVGSYILSIVTQFSGGGRLLNASRTLTLTYVLVVE